MNTTRFEALLTGNKTLIMGVLNVTPDSFSDGGSFFNPEDAIIRVAEMISEGADIIDIGGQSTRPPGNTYGEGATQVDLDEELRRVLPVIGNLIHQYPELIISIDTTKAEVAKRALELGASIVNDVSGGTEDEKILDVAREMRAPVILMHGYGPQFTKSKIEDYHYSNVTEEVFTWLKSRVMDAKELGIKMVIADIGFGFAKNAEDNITLLRNHEKFSGLGVPMLLGVSRKSTIGKILGSVPPLERIHGSIGAAIYGVLHGAKIIRTHDVKQTAEALKVVERIIR